MNKLQSLLDEKDINLTVLVRVMGKPFRITDFKRLIENDKSLLTLNAGTVVSLAKALGMSVEEILLPYEADGTVGAIESVNAFVKKLRKIFGLKDTGSFEAVSSVGEKLEFSFKDSASILRQAGQTPKTESILDKEPNAYDRAVSETARLDEDTKGKIEDRFAMDGETRDPVVIDYYTAGKMNELTLAIFRMSGFKGAVDRIETIKAVWSEGDNPWIKTYVGVTTDNYNDFREADEDNIVTLTEYFDFMGKIILSLRTKRKNET